MQRRSGLAIAVRPTLSLVAAALVAGCRSGCLAGDVAECETLVSRYEACTASGEDATDHALDSMRTFCSMSMRYEPEPGDDGSNLAATTKAALAECAALEACDQLTACLARHRCAFQLTGPDDEEPEFMCWPSSP
jgi:hypothetical protein